MINECEIVLAACADPDGNVTVYHYANSATNKKLDYIDHPMSGRTEFHYTAGMLDYEYRFGNHTVEDWTYDPATLRVSGVLAWSEPLGAALHAETYTYNENWMRTRVDYQVYGQPNHHRLYQYDDLLRLTEQHKRWNSNNATAWRYAYEYDPAGNREQMVRFDGTTTATTFYQHNDANQLTTETVGSNVLRSWYDDNGNLSALEDSRLNTDTFTHDQESRLARFQDGVSGQAVSYVYAPMGRRVLRTDPQGNKEMYFYDGLNILMVREKPSGASAWRTKRVFTLKQAQLGAPIAQSEYAYAGGSSQGTATTTWYHYDMLGNVVAQTGMNGEAVALFEQEAYGNVLSGNPAGLHVTGKEFDPTASLYYFGARWYDPRTGRWIEKEPTGADGPNLYWPFCQNPINAFDANGRETIKQWSPNAQALNDLCEEYARKGICPEDGKALRQLCDEVGWNYSPKITQPYETHPDRKSPVSREPHINVRSGRNFHIPIHLYIRPVLVPPIPIKMLVPGYLDNCARGWHPPEA